MQAIKILFIYLVAFISFMSGSCTENHTPFKESLKIAQLEQVASPRRRVSEDEHKAFIDPQVESITRHGAWIEVQLHNRDKALSTEKTTKKNWSRFFCFSKKKIHAGTNE